ncbi:hypothetical protein ACIPSA_44860 [Streptomyces sp. NPDC086549]|uniref:hypothetical protein n=1 Tax=Streptomyces sp. NPDC086549 TaxID=3365752 RepID=UPI0038076FA1
MDHFEQELARMMRDSQEYTPFEAEQQLRLRSGVQARRRARAVQRAVGSVLAVAGLAMGFFLLPHHRADDRPQAPLPRPALSPASPSTSPPPTPGSSPSETTTIEPPTGTADETTPPPVTPTTPLGSTTRSDPTPTSAPPPSDSETPDAPTPSNTPSAPETPETPVSTGSASAG